MPKICYIRKLRGTKCPESTCFVNSDKGGYLNLFPKKILLENNLTHLLKNKFSKIFYNSREITFSKTLNSSFADFSCSSSFKGAAKWYFTQFFSVVIILFSSVVIIIRVNGGLWFLPILWETSFSSFRVFCVFCFESNFFNLDFQMCYYYLKRVLFMKTHQTIY